MKDTFEFQTEDREEVIATAIIFSKFEVHCKPKKNFVVDRHCFLTRDPGVMLIQNSMTSLYKISKLGMRQVPSTNNISRISMTGHVAGHDIRNKHNLGFSESGTGGNLNIEYY